MWFKRELWHKNALNPLRFPIFLALAMAAVVSFPAIWFKKPTFGGVWFRGKTNVSNWIYQDVPITSAVEKIITCDFATNGEFTNPNDSKVRVFLSSRLREVENDLQLFAHPPDLCWRAAGFEMIPTTPSFRTVTVSGLVIPFERRIFEQNGFKELVYYAGLLSGKPLPFRLGWDRLPDADNATGHSVPIPTLRSLKRIPQTLRSRETLAGAKQFIRISTPVAISNVSRGDTLLENFLKEWLEASGFPTNSLARMSDS